MGKKIVFLFCTCLPIVLFAQLVLDRKVRVAEGWAANSINTVVFRKSAVLSNGNIQYVAYYRQDSSIAIAKRSLNHDQFTVCTTAYKGNVKDAHNSISVGVDGKDRIHIAWDHHNRALKYARGVFPDFPISFMTGVQETGITYPEFYSLPGNQLLFLYRDGSSGNGNLAVKRFDGNGNSWKDIQLKLIDGEGKRNAYWQACVDHLGHIHLSWTWRETYDVATNHDLCYAKSPDGGKTWYKSDGTKYELPIRESTAECIAKIPMNSDLINQTSITTNEKNIPFIASYWTNKGDSIPQYHILYLEDGLWNDINTGFRSTPFSLKGAGTKRIPIARPQVLAWNNNMALVFRDEERGSKLSIAVSTLSDPSLWKISDYSTEGLGAWEPSYDTELWKKKRKLHLFVQKTGQGDGERLEELGQQWIWIYEFSLKK